MTNVDRYEKLNELSDKERKELYELYEKMPNICGIDDLLGQDKNGIINAPSDTYKLNAKIMGRLLENDPKKVTSKYSIWFRKKFLYGMVLDNCIKDINGKKHQMVRAAEIPTDRPVIFMPNHISRNDASASIIAGGRLSYLVFGSLPLLFQTQTGLEAWINGIFVLNRKNKDSKKALLDKIEYAFDIGLPATTLYPEASLNKSPNKLLLEYWKGIFVLSKKSGAPVVPIVHLEVGDKIYSSRLAPVDFKTWEMEQADEALAHLRELAATELYNLMDEFAHTTREEFMLEALEKYKNIPRVDIDFWAKKYPDLTRKQIIDQLITMDEICEFIIKDQVEAAGIYYDYKIETTAHYQPKDRVEPEEVWMPIIKATTIDEEHNQILNRIPKNYQRKY